MWTRASTHAAFHWHTHAPSHVEPNLFTVVCSAVLVPSTADGGGGGGDGCCDNGASTAWGRGDGRAAAGSEGAVVAALGLVEVKADGPEEAAGEEGAAALTGAAALPLVEGGGGLRGALGTFAPWASPAFSHLSLQCRRAGGNGGGTSLKTRQSLKCNVCVLHAQLS